MNNIFTKLLIGLLLAGVPLSMVAGCCGKRRKNKTTKRKKTKKCCRRSHCC